MPINTRGQSDKQTPASPHDYAIQSSLTSVRQVSDPILVIQMFSKCFYSTHVTGKYCLSEQLSELSLCHLVKCRKTIFYSLQKSHEKQNHFMERNQILLHCHNHQLSS